MDEQLKVNLTYDKNCETVKDPSLVIIELTPGLEEDFKKDVFVWLEVEVLQGTRTPLENGSVEYRLHLDEEKRMQLKQMLHSAFFGHPNQAN